MGEIIPFTRSSGNADHNELKTCGILDSYLQCTGWSRVENANVIRFLNGGEGSASREIILDSQPCTDVSELINQSRQALKVLQSVENRPRFEIIMTMIVRHL